ncbi:hypothetical protein E3N88_18141 [Mikania micrantha]|uniref:Uncharacterized protein n=1 Tax=Mikania micrantha TaxID=192012 RepID=A0A5N6NW31_9ASTR|nr:hypothetical protein E3N88_18141 [Mikania micrantha]
MASLLVDVSQSGDVFNKRFSVDNVSTDAGDQGDEDLCVEDVTAVLSKINDLARKKIKLCMEFQHFLSKSPDTHCHAKSCTGSADPCTTVHNFARPCN